MASWSGFKGIDVRQTSQTLLLRSLLQTGSGTLVVSGSLYTNVQLYEFQNDGTIQTFDFVSGTFQAGATANPTTSGFHQKANNSTVETGIWTCLISGKTGFHVGALYAARMVNSGASPVDQYREFQYGSYQGDLVTTSGASLGLAYLQTDAEQWAAGPTTSGAIPAAAVGNSGGLIGVGIISGFLAPQRSGMVFVANSYDKSGYTVGTSLDKSGYTVGTNLDKSGYMAGIDWSNIINLTATVDLSNTTIGGVDNDIGPIHSGTCQAGSTSTNIVLDAGASATNNYYNGCGVYLTGGTGVGQFRYGRRDYDGTAKTLSVYPAWTTTPDNTTTFALLPANMPDFFTALSLDSSGGTKISTNWDKSGYTVGTSLDKSGYTVGANLDKSGYILNSGAMEGVQIYTGVNMRQSQQLILNTQAANTSGAGTSTFAIADYLNSGTNRIVATIDSSGNRTVTSVTVPT